MPKFVNDEDTTPYFPIGLSQLYLSNLELRGCTVRFMLRPAALAGTPDWVNPQTLRAVSVPCRGKFSLRVTTQTRPQPAYPKGQLITRRVEIRRAQF